MYGNLEHLFSNMNDSRLRVENLEQGWGILHFGYNLLEEQGIVCGGKKFETGFSTHANSRIRISSTKDMKEFRVFCGITQNSFTEAEKHRIAPMTFQLETENGILAQRGPLKYAEIDEISVVLPEKCRSFDLVVSTSDIHSAHAAWTDPVVIYSDGSRENPALEPPALLDKFPVSFFYDDLDSHALFRTNPPLKTTVFTEKGAIHTFVSETGALRMTVVLTVYKNYPVWEWHTEFENTSGVRSGRLHDVRTIDINFRTLRMNEFELIRHRGSCDDSAIKDWGSRFRETYLPIVDPFRRPMSFTFGATDGRPSVDWLPCFDLTDGKTDLRFVTGWSGQWTAGVSLSGANACFSIRSGMEDLDTVLEPGEKISQPSSFFLMTENGGKERMINLWRKFVTENIMLPLEGKPPVPPVAVTHWGGMGEKEQIIRFEDIQKYKIPFDVYWIDAGWFAPENDDEFSSVWGETVGDWNFDRENFPDELRNLSKKLHAAGKKLLLWFEPERIWHSHAAIAREHPEWMVFQSGGGEYGSGNALLDLGNPEAWEWMWQKITGIIERNGIDWYREDFNFSPLPYWRKKDVPDRRGITEIRFTEGLRKFWKCLREKFPHLMIDNCSSGGRRLDIELLRYSMPLWFSDMQCAEGFDCEYNLSHIAGFSSYWPRFGCGIKNSAGGDTYNFRTSLVPSAIVCGYFYSMHSPVNDEYPREWLKARLAEYEQIRECLSGDFYELIETRPHAAGGWSALFQYDLPEQNRGTVLAYRSKESIVTECVVRLRCLNPDAVYHVYDVDGRMTPLKKTGCELMEQGFTFRMEEPRAAGIILYERCAD